MFANPASLLEHAALLSSLLVEAGYTGELTGTIAAAGGPPTGDEYSETSSDTLLAALYLHGRSVARASLQEDIGSLRLAQLLSAGLLVVEAGGAVRSPVQVYPLKLHRGGSAETAAPLLLCTDWDVASVGDERRDAVMPIGVDSLTLALGLSPAAVAGRSVLDVCCGSGVLGLVAARLGAARVLCTDVSLRAVCFARFNAALNGFAEACVTAAQGDGYEPALARAAGAMAGGGGGGGCDVGGDAARYDVILSNPPFVAVPTSLRLEHATALYVSGGDDGADIVRLLVRGAAEVLAASGLLLIVAQLANISSAHETLHAQMHASVGATRLTVVYDDRHTQQRRAYAAGRARDLPGVTTSAYAAALAEAGVETMGFGVVVAQRLGGGAGGSCHDSGGGARSLRLQTAGGTAATATMLVGRGREMLQRCILGEDAGIEVQGEQGQPQVEPGNSDEAAAVEWMSKRGNVASWLATGGFGIRV